MGKSGQEEQGSRMRQTGGEVGRGGREKPGGTDRRSRAGRTGEEGEKNGTKGGAKRPAKK